MFGFLGALYFNLVQFLEKLKYSRLVVKPPFPTKLTPTPIIEATVEFRFTSKNQRKLLLVRCMTR